MKRFEQQQEEPQLGQFREEIERLKTIEEKAGTSAHLRGAENIPEVNTAELTNEDMEIWQKLKDNILTIEEFENYRNDVVNLGNSSRGDFVGFVGNRLQKLMWEKKSNED